MPTAQLAPKGLLHRNHDARISFGIFDFVIRIGSVQRFFVSKGQNVPPVMPIGAVPVTTDSFPAAILVQICWNAPYCWYFCDCVLIWVRRSVIWH